MNPQLRKPYYIIPDISMARQIPTVTALIYFNRTTSTHKELIRATSLYLQEEKKIKKTNNLETVTPSSGGQFLLQYTLTMNS